LKLKLYFQFVFVKADGTHHLHLNTPENVSTLIVDFLQCVPEPADGQSTQLTKGEATASKEKASATVNDTAAS
jgi:hypothetical protein